LLQLKGNKPDNYSLGCFVFVELTLLSKIILRTAAMIGINSREPNKSLTDYLAGNQNDPLICTYNLAYFFGITFFTIALLLNAARWLSLSLSVHQNRVIPRKVVRLLQSGLFLVIMLLVGSAIN
jgi:hypothetical protein